MPEIVLQELDASESISDDWVVTSMSDEVLKHAEQFPEDLTTVTDEDVRLSQLINQYCS